MRQPNLPPAAGRSWRSFTGIRSGPLPDLQRRHCSNTLPHQTYAGLNLLPHWSLNWSWRGKELGPWLKWDYNFAEAVVLALLETPMTMIQLLKYSGLQSKRPTPTCRVKTAR